MRDLTCAGCGCDLPHDRCVVRIEGYSLAPLDEAAEPPSGIAPSGAESLQRDPLDDLAEQLDSNSSLPQIEPATRLRLVVCPECYQRFLQQPLGPEAARVVSYSRN